MLERSRDPVLGLGDCYTFTAIDRTTKLMPCYMLGYRTAECAEQFMADQASRLANRVQLTTDGMNSYPAAVAKPFGIDVDFAVLNKSYEGGLPQVEAKRRYSPAVCVGATKNVVCGDPDFKNISTSHVERANLTMRMGMRRFTRLTNGFSKKIEMHTHAVSLHFMHYNFARIHKTLKISGGCWTPPWPASGPSTAVSPATCAPCVAGERSTTLMACC